VSVIAACYLLSRLFGARWGNAFTALVGVLTFLAMVHALNEHSSFVTLGEQQQRVIAPIIAQAPHLKPDTWLVLIDKPPFYAWRVWSACAIISDCLGYNLSYIYHENISQRTRLCTWGYAPRDKYSEVCSFDQKGITVTYIRLRDDAEIVATVPYEKAVIFE